MRISTRLSMLLFGLCVLAPRLALAADVAVFAPEISNLSPQDATSVGELIAQAYAAVSQQSVLSPTQTQPALAQAKAYEAAAAQLGVKEYIRLSAVAAGQRLVITAGRYQLDGRPIAQLKQTAESIEDMALASDSIAKALYTGNAPSAPAFTAGQPIAAAAPSKPAPKRDDVVYGVKTGVHLPFAKNADYYSAVSLQFDGRVELPRFFLEFGAGFVIPTVIDESDDYCGYNSMTGVEDCSNVKTGRGHVGGITTELGASYYLTNTNVTPYIGGGIIPRIILAGLDNQSRRDIASMSVYAQLGLTFPRERSTRFFFDLRLAQALLEQHLQNGKEVWPTEPSLHAGIGW